jgi:hypothetical protein
MVCQAFEFKHLPMPGGIFDQHPGMLDRFIYILGEQAKHREREENERKRGQLGPRPKNGRMGTSRPSY